MNRLALIPLLGALLVTTGCSFLGLHGRNTTDPATAEAIAMASIGTHRSEKNIARNVYRHPVETLSFFGLRSDMTVIEALPGGLWYSEILAPVLRDKGLYIAANYDADLPDQPDYRLRGRANMVARALLCFDYLVQDIVLEEGIDLTNPDEVANAVVENSGCASCHQTLDPLASFLWVNRQNWGAGNWGRTLRFWPCIEALATSLWR